MIARTSLEWVLIGVVIAIVFVIARFIDQFALHKAKKTALILDQNQEEECLMPEQ